MHIHWGRWAGEGRIYPLMQPLLKETDMTALLHPSGIGPTHGQLSIFSAPKSVLTHIQWSLGECLGAPAQLNWKPQSLVPGTWCTSMSWNSNLGAGARIASTLRGWHYLNFEVYEAATNGSDGSLFLFTPELGLFRANVGPHGDIMISEHQISSLMFSRLRQGELACDLEKLLGKPWHEALEPFRRAQIDGAESSADRISV